MQSWTSPGGNTPQDTNCTATCPPITKTIQVRRTRHAGHCWRSRDELIRDVLLWTPTHGRAKAGRPARTYIQQLCEDTGCCPEDLPRAMNDREEWRERVRDIRATSAIWWWNFWDEAWWFLLLRVSELLSSSLLFNKRRSSKFREGSRVRQTPEEGRRTYRPKRCENNKDEDNSPKILNDETL